MQNLRFLIQTGIETEIAGNSMKLPRKTDNSSIPFDSAAVPRTPAFVLEEALLDRNLRIIADVQDQAPCSFLLALKGFAMFSVFPRIAETARGATASSLYECRLAAEFFPGQVHAYAPVYREEEFPEFVRTCRHITFNSLSQYRLLKPIADAAAANAGLKKLPSFGLRVNPQYAAVETDLYNPCIPGSRLGVQPDALKPSEELPGGLPDGIAGLHVHNLCESGAAESAATIRNIRKLYGHLLPKIQWLNLGGGHLVTRKGYRTELLVQALEDFHRDYPHIELILEPGAAFVWETGILAAEVKDIVRSGSVLIAMLDTSFAAHMPDCLEMPYTPRIRGAEIVSYNSEDQSAADSSGSGGYIYRMGGSSCLAGDFVGDYRFAQPLSIGDRIVFEDMMHYTMVKTNMFNGIGLPDIGIWTEDGTYQLIRSFSYDDYKGRLS